MAQYPSPYDEEDDDDVSSQRPARRFAVDLTGMGVRVAATAMIIGLSILIIYFAIRPRGDGATSAGDAATPPASEEVEATSGDPLATFTPGPTSTPPPLNEPTPEPTQGPPPGTLAVGANAVVAGTGTDGLNMRSEGTTTATIVQILQDGTTLTLVEGPVEGEGRQWWRVRLADGAEGWVVQDFLTPG